jgi:hypothetical protein
MHLILFLRDTLSGREVFLQSKQNAARIDVQIVVRYKCFNFMGLLNLSPSATNTLDPLSWAVTYKIIKYVYKCPNMYSPARALVMLAKN